MDPLPDSLLELALDDAGRSNTVPVSASLNRYELIRVIGRGGSGTVWLARDSELDRHVAVKLLHIEYELSEARVQRFRAEARIGSRLQHPNIAPVYDLGTTGDGTLFLVMRLVSGRTLAEAFAARRHPDDDRVVLLAAYVQFAQAIAYAHAEGVVHRDLKPSNVMLGRFGEVLVMDWGLAKSRTESISKAFNESPSFPPVSAENLTEDGSVFGTPAYMAPEQAGRAGSADFRSDVYAMGAILFELLTGSPPRQRGSQPMESPDTAGLSARLASADPPLARLAVECLATDPADRPADGGVVAQAVTAHLLSVQEQLAAAELAAQTAVVVAREQRRRWRLWAGLAAVLSLVAIGGAWVWNERQRAEAEDERAVLALLVDADRALASGRRAEAEAAVRTADGRARRAKPAVRERVAGRLADLRMLDRLADIRLTRGRADSEPLSPRRRDREGLMFDRSAGFYYRAAFQEYGLDPFAVDAAERIRGSAIANDLAAAVDAWAANSPGDRAALNAVASAADPDPTGLPAIARAAVASGNISELLSTIAANANPPVTTAVMVGRLLRSRGESARAVAFLRPLRDRNPGDFWLNLELAAASLSAGQSADPWRSVAEALAGGEFEVDLYLGKAAYAVGRLTEAEAEFRRAVSVSPNSALAQVGLAVVLTAQGKADEGIRELKAALAKDPTDPVGWYNLGIVLQQKPATLTGAADAYKKAVALYPDYFEGWNNLGNTLTTLARYDEAEDAFRKAIKAKANYALAEFNLGVLFAETQKIEEAITAYRRSLTIRPDYPEAHYNLAHLLIMQAGRFAEGREVLASSRKYVRDPGPWDRLNSAATTLAERDAVVDGPRPTDPAGLRERAELLAWPHRKRYTAAADWLAASFDGDPVTAADLKQGFRYFAATCAARAAAGHGLDTDPLRVPELRARALKWLRADVALWKVEIDSKDSTRQKMAREKLKGWLVDPNLTSIRGESLAGLSETERNAWSALWAEVASLTTKQ